MHTYESTELDALQHARNYYAAIHDRFRAYLGQRVAEVGAGRGTFAERLLATAGVGHLVLVEPAENLYPLLRSRFAADRRVRVEKRLEDLAAGSVDAAVLVNVLEHIGDDAGTLRQLHGILKPGGALLLLVPAFGFLYGTLDEAFGHVRRYTKASLSETLRQTGFDIESLRYFNAPGVLSWFLAGRILRRRTIRTEDVKRYDKWVMSWLPRLERRVSPPFGQSLVAIGRRADVPNSGSTARPHAGTSLAIKCSDRSNTSDTGHG
jgi:SAM-dependent methyltransferase